MPVKDSILTYDQLTPSQKVFMFNFILEEAAKAVFDQWDMAAYTSFVAPEFEKLRPRAELVFTVGPGQLRWAPRASLPEALRSEKIESAYKGVLHIRCISSEDHLIHSAYVCQVRSQMVLFKSLVNDVQPMTLHCVQLCVPGGESPAYKPETGVYSTDLIYNLDFSIQANAWALLAPQ